MSAPTLRLALGHCAPGYDDVQNNIAMLTRLIKQAAACQPDLLLPELAISGYCFAAVMGLE